MHPPIPAHARDTTGLAELDAQLLACPTAVGTPVRSSLSQMEIPFHARRSGRSVGRTSLERALDVVAPLVTATAQWTAEDGYVERQTLVPSAGGRHPLTALILHQIDGAPHRAWAVGPSLVPELFEVRHHAPAIEAVLAATARSLRKAEPPGTVVVVLARFRRTLSKYIDGQSLVWRDAGAFLATAHLLATSLDLHSCIAGIAETAEFPLAGSLDTLVDVGALSLAEKEQE